MKEITMPYTRYRRNLKSIIRRNEQVAIKISRCGVIRVVHVPHDMYVNMKEEIDDTL